MTLEECLEQDGMEAYLQKVQQQQQQQQKVVRAKKDTTTSTVAGTGTDGCHRRPHDTVIGKRILQLEGGSFLAGGLDFDPNQLWDEHCSLLLLLLLKVLPPSASTTTTTTTITQEQQTTTTIAIDVDDVLGGVLVLGGGGGTLASSTSTSSTAVEVGGGGGCCEFGPLHSDWTYLRLPALHEPAIRLHIPYYYVEEDYAKDTTTATTNMTIMTLELEQEGYLRLFDVSGILWPSGYLLTLCMGNLWQCLLLPSHDDLEKDDELSNLWQDYNDQNNMQQQQQQQHRPFALELGAGIGAASIALAKRLSQRKRASLPSSSSSSPWVIATDHAPHALALTLANAHFNTDNQTGDNGAVAVEHMDHFNQSSVRSIRQKYFSEGGKEEESERHDGFSLVLGSSLQGLFADTHQANSPLWMVLDELLSYSKHAMAVLVHTRDEPRLEEPAAVDGKFRLVRRISGSHELFGRMTTRWGDESEFEISIFRRR